MNNEETEEVEQVEKVEVKEEPKKSARYFKILDENDSTHCRFYGKKPKQAANNAFIFLQKKNKKEIDSAINFSIVECTRGSERKIYKYEGQRKKLSEKMVVTTGDKTIM